ncbi:MAG: sugar-transfer associated ATP-grasp domain-containing protein [Candidatus Faecousia sp.]|nr:hypothetical protein [Clostridiales bacterium]MDY4220104.1 sugar-transfer associated ATP-grasp domain-containing protein [Candidatus Faecousia sp.]
MGLGTKAAIFARRLRTASFQRMNQNIQAIHRETGRNRCALFLDMLWCTFRYGVGYLDYHVFGFAKNRGANRKTFMTMNHNVALARMVNDSSLYPLLNDKFLFLEKYGAFLGRRWLDLREADWEALRDFCLAHGTVFAKPHADFGGKGVEKLTPGPEEDFPALHRRLRENGQFLVEEAICQHPEMNRLCPASVNTIRVVTLVVEGEARFVYALLRMGSGQSHVDNISSGGMYTLIGPEGVLEFPAFCDKTGLYYDRHPATGTVFAGFRVPCFVQAVELCRRAALVEPRLGYIGWDVAVTPDGPVLVEGNNLPGYDMAQNAKFHPDGRGLLPTFEALLGRPIPRA